MRAGLRSAPAQNRSTVDVLDGRFDSVDHHPAPAAKQAQPLESEMRRMMTRLNLRVWKEVQCGDCSV